MSEILRVVSPAGEQLAGSAAAATVSLDTLNGKTIGEKGVLLASDVL